MSNAAKIRKKAAEFEQLKQFDRAIATYARAIEESEKEGDEVDVNILNKVGDLALRQGRVSDAVTYYERAVEHYATAGLFNNAIALCNKLLRSAPGRCNVYLTLGRICARKGLRGDATRNFLEYASRMQQEGRVDEGMRALAEVSDLMPELTEIRRLVDEHAARAGISLRRRNTLGDLEAQADVVLRSGLQEKPNDLVFLDLGESNFSGGNDAFDGDEVENTPQATPRSRRSGSSSNNSLEDLMLFDPSSADEPELEDIDQIEPGAYPSDAVDEASSEVVDAHAPFRLDPDDFVQAGELPPFVLDDSFLDGSISVGRSRADFTRTTPALPLASVAAEASALAQSRRDSLRHAVADTPLDWQLRRRLAEALFEAGERDAGLAELETALQGLLRAEEFEGASQIADELVRVGAERVPYHQKRVEIAVRLRDQVRLRAAYLDLADTLLQSGDDARARAVYARVLEIDPSDDRARAALGDAVLPQVDAPSETAATPAPSNDARSDDDAVNLADWLQDPSEPASTRMRMREPVASGDEQADFENLLRHFKEGVSRSLGEEDYESHYDLGIAFKEMGLIDDAVVEFQKALRSRTHRLPAYEALGQCFVEQERFQVATTVLTRAMHEPGLTDEQRIGVLYLLAFSSEKLQRIDDARSYYQRVYATDTRFRDVARCLERLDPVAQ